MTLFSIRDLSVDVPGRRLLEGISLDLPQGRVTGLIGHNGSGKSTLLKVLARQIEAWGAVAFEGRALAGWNARDYARRLAFLPQTTPPAEGMLVRELVELGRYPWHGALGRFGPRDEIIVARAMAECGVARFAERLVDTLSGGERQRVWLAMMVAQQASTLLLDEPISALDIAHAVEVMRLVRTMCREEGRSVVVVLHEVNMAAQFCDHIVALKQGQVVLEGPPDELMTAERLQQIYSVRMEVLHRADGQRVAVPA
ncbi:ATP-binding cassette domain-containing protein [Rhodobacter sphaeroides]|jgi:ABC-type cobalamin/Fe3+-siderophores transport systems, ATPase components|uniref:ABC Fe+3 hydroxamate (Ferrichrome) transporter, ATPase subunit n=1 Tax=Cereibacter sphaeroides (strain ATCC 17023 / DSM 158 / JCM 6121 / CCUG 31486 / LMG 2827 / NBRC 12203 / NCIMB 8253 / ATH 2.4.1.) TaxID=272943 RepID=Q3J6K6_CERS4|nr:ATP-binding cassette domain-containing protein [Cereibacter sphaeroides]ABA77578.1 ABC Fe+3 hydroxamate (ferrichrome) transporter, ATPase subunit [Cereibacter sphaeroides 2.4.1]AMJ45982.1 iron ABC transporter substrate-binding protein [Cereibacter sphaeroides]ANS32693.1 iron ABC transporter substrate-binding protein [Cereibacter sphaeroides]ATN61746.1 iron ABC transporter substrate-binding protein [Cereibacter sphaeroides]AXC59828.1 ATP-binding cassette domain-containing protein [Cereibacte